MDKKVVAMDKKVVAAVFQTSDYTAFKTLEGNRNIDPTRVNKIKKSIMDNGYIHSPIIVNENWEVIDGQGRLEALTALGLPVEFMMFRGLTIKDCIALNVYNTGWTVMDYIESHAERGNMSYKFLLHLITKYKELCITVIINSITGIIGNSSNVTNSIKTGSFECSGEQYQKADELLAYVMKFLKTIKNFHKGPLPYICMAIMFAYQLEEVDKKQLVEKFERYYGLDDIPPFNGADGALKALTIVYNRRNSKNRLYFEVEYDKFLSGKYAWYTNKWGKKK